MTPEKKSSAKSKEKLLETAKKRFKLAVEAEIDIRKEALEDLKFRSGEQWPDDIKNERSIEKRPCLVINRIPQFIRQITNDQRQNRPSIKVSPVDDKADVETAKIYQGLIRHIEYSSGADVAYDTAFEGAVTKGFGFFRVNTKYVDHLSFNQEITIDPVHDDFAVFLDPHSKLPDGSDANWGFVVERVAKDDYDAEYSESKMAQMEDWDSIGLRFPEWMTKDSCVVAEYFYKEFKDVTLLQLEDGTVVQKESLDEIFPDGLPETFKVVSERKAKEPVIKWCKINAVEILEETEWPGQWIPIIPVYGDRYIVDGKKTLEGVVRHARDPQRMLNYWKSTETETIALAPKAPFIVAEGQIPKQYEHQWRSANRKTHAYLTYSPTSHQGQALPPPQRNSFEPPVVAITNASLAAAEDLKSTTGIYDASLGSRSNETSGIAIQRRNLQAQTSNFHLVDNLTRSIRHAGRIIVDLIPKIYDTAQAARIIGEEGEQEIIRLNEEFKYKGKLTSFNLGVGKYDVAVETGPSFATKRQEAVESMLGFVQAYPQSAQFIGDLIAKNMDWPGSHEISERLKKTLPPGLAEDPYKPPIPPEIQAQLQQMSQMVEMLTNQLNEANSTIKEKRLELESRERIEAAKLETDILLEKMKQAQAFAQAQVDRQLQELQSWQDQSQSKFNSEYALAEQQEASQNMEGM